MRGDMRTSETERVRADK